MARRARSTASRSIIFFRILFSNFECGLLGERPPSATMYQLVSLSCLLSSLLPVNGNSDPFIPMSRMVVRFPGEETNDSSFVSKFKSRISRQNSRLPPSPREDDNSTTAVPASWGFEDDDYPSDSSPNSNIDRNDTVSPLRYLSSQEDEEELSDKRHILGDVLSLTSSEGTTPRHPVVYRYYGRNQALTHSYGSIPFLLLGPNVDHWKVAGKELASRGYNAIACERVLNEEDVEKVHKAKKRLSSSESLARTPDDPITSWNESALLVLQLLDALRWNKAVLVACDSQTLVAIEAAMLLAPHRVSGVVLCGRIPNVDDLLPKEGGMVAEEIRRRMAGGCSSVDQYLKKHLRCPSMIVWDGAVPSLVADSSSSLGDELSSATADIIARGRSLILGGGSAPHRRRPELFAWALTRFVEEQVDPHRHDKEGRDKRRELDKEEVGTHGEDGDDPLPKSTRSLPFHLALLFSPGSMVVYGRILATALFYGIVMKTLIFQYENIRWGIFNVKSKIDLIASLPRRLMRVILAPLPNPRALFTTLSGILPFWSRGSSDRENEAGGLNASAPEADPEEAPSSTELDESDATDALDDEQESRIETESTNDEVQGEPGHDTKSPEESPENGSKEEDSTAPIRPIMFLDHVIV